MRKVIAIVLMVMMMVGACGTAQASDIYDTIKTIEDYCKSMLDGFCVIYESVGTSWYDEDYTELAYRYYMMYEATNKVAMKEAQFSIKNLTGSDFGIDRTAETGWILVRETVNEKWEAYINEEITMEEFLDWFMPIVRTQIGESTIMNGDSGK